MVLASFGVSTDGWLLTPNSLARFILRPTPKHSATPNTPSPETRLPTPTITIRLAPQNETMETNETDETLFFQALIFNRLQGSKVT